MRYEPVTAESAAAEPGLEDWRFIRGALHGTFRTGSFTTAASFAALIAGFADEADHHPDVALRYPDRVIVSTTTHFTGGLSRHDLDLARRISRAADESGFRSEPAAPQVVEFVIDTTGADRIRPFWAAVLGYVEQNGDLLDPQRLGPSMWFQHSDEPRSERNRIHIDVSVPHDVAATRIAAALAAGGRMVTDRFARSWWVLADADGNEACICTWLDS